MNEYEERAESLIASIDQSRRLRDAQVSTSPAYSRYQDECTTLTADLQDWQWRVPVLRELDAKILNTTHLHQGLDSSHNNHVARATKRRNITGGIAVLVLLLGLVGLGWWAIVLGLLGCGAAVVMHVLAQPHRSPHYGHMTSTRSRLEQLHQERDETYHGWSGFRD